MTHPGTIFRALHVAGQPFIMANVWDKGSAKMLQSMGAKALATSSAAHAFTVGRVDGGTLTRDEALAHAYDILSVATVPVQGDFENGFGDSPEDCAQTVRMAGEIGLAGICIEDTILPGDTPYAYDLAVDRIRAAASAARALPHDFVLTARADGIMIGTYDTDTAIKRLQGFADAGADCLYAPMPPDMAGLTRICTAVNKPVNALIAGEFAGQSMGDFAAAGVARLSLGSALARVTHRAIYDTAREMFDGQFSTLRNGISSDIIDRMMT
jgi:2-methylisocitrate lyase-like PEP mutase family enzyme